MTELHYPLYYRRRPTRDVRIGSVFIGSRFPVRIQSMLTSHTYNSQACFNEIRDLANAGCEIIRLTVPTQKDLAGVPEIRRLMHEEGIAVPLVADIHFAPHLAVDACEFFEKIRINPGNFSDRPKNSSERSKQHFDIEEGREKLRERIRKLVPALKKYDRALRIGVNHGSLSARMIQQYGDSPVGMVQSALETIELFEAEAFYNIAVSLKSSNPFVMQKAYRLFCEYNTGENSVPLHLGVTEAGNEEMGRIKSVSGIAALLTDGIGDTIRVSLTEPSVNEIEFAKKLTSFTERYISGLPCLPKQSNSEKNDLPFLSGDVSISRRKNKAVSVSGIITGNAEPVRVGIPAIHRDRFPESDFTYNSGIDNALFKAGDARLSLLPEESVNLNDHRDMYILSGDAAIFDLRRIYRDNLNEQKPVGYIFPEDIRSDSFESEIFLANAVGEGLLDFILIPENLPVAGIRRIKQILQVTRVKLTETDYIACPSCGRTLFDLTEVTAEIKKHTSHLIGLKIGIMGCIVNGPGEMADADFGYVGAGTDKIDLYVQKDRVKKNIPQSEAVNELIALIKSAGRWKEPPSV